MFYARFFLIFKIFEKELRAHIMVEKVIGSIARKFSSGTMAAYQSVSGMINRMGQIKFDLDVEDESADEDEDLS